MSRVFCWYILQSTFCAVLSTLSSCACVVVYMYVEHAYAPSMIVCMNELSCPIQMKY